MNDVRWYDRDFIHPLFKTSLCYIEGQFSFKLKSLSTVDLNLMSNKSSVSIGQKKCVFFSNLTTNQNSSSKNAKLYCIPISKKQKPHYGGKNYEFYLMYLCVYSFVHFRWLITSFPLFYFRTPWLGSSLMIIELLSSHQLWNPFWWLPSYISHTGDRIQSFWQTRNYTENDIRRYYSSYL